MRPELKVCGVTEPAFAAEAARRGVDYVGVIFAAGSPRRVDVARARQVAAAVRKVYENRRELLATDPKERVLGALAQSRRNG